MRPLFLRPIPIKFDAVFVWIAEVKCFTHSVIACAVKRDPGGHQASEGVGELGARWIKNRKVK